jgi:hypothetical protein
MTYVDYAVLNLAISLAFFIASSMMGMSPLSSIPNGLLAIVFLS